MPQLNIKIMSYETLHDLKKTKDQLLVVTKFGNALATSKKLRSQTQQPGTAAVNPGNFAPIPIDRFGLGYFGPISGVGCFRPNVDGSFSPIVGASGLV